MNSYKVQIVNYILSYFRMSEATSSDRITAMFEESVSGVLEIVLSLPDDQRKMDLIQKAIEQIRFLKFSLTSTLWQYSTVDTNQDKKEEKDI